MILMSLFVIEDITSPSSSNSVTQQSNTGTINIAELSIQTASSSSFSLSTDNWFGFYGFILVIMGFALNSRNITLKNERYGEIVKKIRV
jgi:hypothetical protein